MRLSLFAVAAVLMLSGCNTYYQDTYEKILVRTPGVENGDCVLYTAKNRYAVITPRQVVVERSNLPMTVICEKTGYYPASVVVRSKIYAPASSLNLLNGYLPGMAWDIADNSVYNYPDPILVSLLPMPQQFPEEETPYVLQKKPVRMKPAPPPAAPPAAAADQSMSNSLRK